MNVKLDDLVNLLRRCEINVIGAELEFCCSREHILVLNDIGMRTYEFETNRITQIRLCGHWFFIDPVPVNVIYKLADVIRDGYKDAPGVIRDYSLGDINLLVEK